MPTLRDYQEQDVAAIKAALQTNQRVLCRAATGLGKAVELAVIALWMSLSGRVMILVDQRKLVEQLAKTIKAWTGISPGIEMGEQRAINENGYCESDRIVISTPQTQYSERNGKPRYHDFAGIIGLLLDETETFPVGRSREVVDYYLSNPECKCVGFSATPWRTDGVAMANLFQAVAVNRDINWGVKNGWLVKPKQAFVTVSADFSTLKIHPRDDGEPDYSDEEVAALLSNERTLIELAKGIVKVASDKKTIVVCPNVTFSRAISDYIEAEKPGSSRSIYGTLGDEEKNDIFLDFEQNKFQFLSSCMMLTKGFDDDQVAVMVMCRKTKSTRLYIQCAGRAVRPLKGILEGLETPAERRKAIISSAKPEAIIVDMVGVDAEVKDSVTGQGVVNLLGDPDEALEILERAKELVYEKGIEADAAIEQAKLEVEDEQELERMAAEAEALKIEEDEEQAFLRRRVKVEAHVEVSYEDGTQPAIAPAPSAIAGAEYISPAQLSMLRKFKVSEQEIAKLSPEAANKLGRTLIMRSKKGLCTWGQAKLLQRHGFSKEQLRTMSRQQAKEHIDRVMSK